MSHTRLSIVVLLAGFISLFMVKQGMTTIASEAPEITDEHPSAVPKDMPQAEPKRKTRPDEKKKKSVAPRTQEKPPDQRSPYYRGYQGQQTAPRTKPHSPVFSQPDDEASPYDFLRRSRRQTPPVFYEFSSLEGITEDVTDLTLNLKRVSLKLIREKPKFANKRRQLLGSIEKAQNVYELWSSLDPLFTFKDWWQLYQELRRMMDQEYWNNWRMRTRYYGESHPAPREPRPGENDFGSDWATSCAHWSDSHTLTAHASLMGDGTCDYARGTILFYDWLDWWGEAIVPGTSMDNVGQYPAEVSICRARAGAVLMEKMKTYLADKQAACPSPCRFTFSTSGVESSDSCAMVISTKPVEHYNHNTNVNTSITVTSKCSP